MKRYPKYGTKKYTTSAGNPHLREGGWTYYPDKVKGRDYEGMPVTFWLQDAFDNVAIYENADDEYAIFHLEAQHRPIGNAKTGDVLLYWRKESKPYIYPSMSAAIDAAIRAYPHEFNIHDSGKLFKSPPSRKKKARKRVNPSKISEQAAQALLDGKRFKSGNTEVVQVEEDPTGETFHLILHGSVIAQYDIGEDWLSIRTAGYPTVTTKDRLNALPGVRVHTSKGQLYLNGKKWNGERKEIK